MGRRGPRPAEARLRRLLVMLPWLMERGEVPVSEAADRFGLTEQELVRDLELVAMCGLPPFVDELIDVFVDEGMIWVGVPRLFTRPLRLNAVEAWELLAAGRAAMALPGADPDGPLGRGLDKLAAVLGGDDGGSVRVELDTTPEADRVASAAARHEELRIRYRSASRDETSERCVVPRRVFADRGHWYVVADDDRSGSTRTFRVDRIESIEPTGRVLPPDPAASDEPAGAPGTWFADASVPSATLRLGPSGRWVIEHYPVDEVGEPDDDGWVTVRVPVASERWLAETLVQLGPDGELIDPTEWRDLAARTAQQVLARYRDLRSGA